MLSAGLPTLFILLRNRSRSAAKVQSLGCESAAARLRNRSKPVANWQILVDNLKNGIIHHESIHTARMKENNIFVSV
ncbi:MAG: hypothetical protein LBD89_05170 [Tannerellaceae bacterium]|jgi:hypothetical protein|nr:hypothetical protein [Tannerellaceae bacterium]